MSKQTEALKLALEALEGWGKGFPDNWGDLDTEAITAIKEALAQPEQETVFWYKPYPNGMYNGPIHNAQIGDVLRGSEEWIPLYTAPPQCKPTDEMVVAAARVLSERHAAACSIDRGDLWKLYGNDFIDDAHAALEAAHGIKGDA